ncbi:DNA-3-methyladenine glycosylase I [Herbaspirillum rubrisubalbicans]|uniref:DNA-3-methyladenine glycosylase I n=1 Tax=Herbaspirillum rubrisubalbicans TaxID=80842 RepID=UPI0020A6C07B|nr:DNA-3-methyladenine glycosylase I [Herbaspirillum rubrisubalbicans]
MNQSTVDGPDGRARCRWCAQAPEFLHYHDTEWGFPVTDDFRLFEKLSLESFQSGLSWRTILAKRENFRTAFEGFDYNKLAGFGPNDIERLLKNEGIVRHRGKIASVLHNAPIARDIATEHGSLAAFLWQYAPAVQPSDRAQTVSVCRHRCSCAAGNAIPCCAIPGHRCAKACWHWRNRSQAARRCSRPFLHRR